MKSIFPTGLADATNPLDSLEGILSSRDVAFDRLCLHELVSEVGGSWCNYRLWFTWQDQMGALMFTCALEGRVPQNRRAAVYPLLAKVNEHAWIGHFDLSSEDGSLAFRHAVLVRGATPNETLEDVIDIALAECERFYPAFQGVIWGGKTCENALESSMFETMGEA